MNVILIKLFGFFLGLFVILFAIEYINITNKKIEKFETSSPLQIQEISSNEGSYTSNDVPYKKFKYMCISTYFNNNQINNSEGRWYECDINLNELSAMNEKDYFTFKTNIKMKPNTMNEDGAQGADISNNELAGPKSFFLANNINTNEINEFSMLMTTKIREFKANDNIIFEMSGNTETILGKDNSPPTYITSIININFQLNNTRNYDVIITIGDVIYKGHIDNIDKNIIRNNDYLIIGLIYSSKQVIFLLNKQRFTYETKEGFNIKLGSSPVIINKGGMINMDLYNFIYYKIALPAKEYDNYYKFTNNHLSGLNSVVKDLEIKDEVMKKQREEFINQNNLKEIENKINKSPEIINKPIKEPVVKTLNYPPLKLTEETEEIDSPLSFIIK